LKEIKFERKMIEILTTHWGIDKIYLNSTVWLKVSFYYVFRLKEQKNIPDSDQTGIQDFNEATTIKNPFK